MNCLNSDQAKYFHASFLKDTGSVTMHQIVLHSSQPSMLKFYDRIFYFPIQKVKLSVFSDVSGDGQQEGNTNV